MPSHPSVHFTLVTPLSMVAAFVCLLGMPCLAAPARAACPIKDPTCGPPDPCDTTTCGSHDGPDKASFTWRLETLKAIAEGDEADGALSETDFDHTNESDTSPVLLGACASTATGDIRSYRWSFSDGEPAISSDTCAATWRRPVSHDYAAVNVTLTIVPGSGAPFSVTHEVLYRDLVIASLGDSAASGEGASERIGKGSPAFLASQECGRSGWAASAQAALRLQRALTDTTVHFWHLACAGASITSDGSAGWGDKPADNGGLLDPFDGTYNNVNPALEPQVRRLGELRTQSGLPVDRLLLTVGANDTHWATVAKTCLPLGIIPPVQATCLNNYARAVTTAVAALPAHFARLHAELTPELAPGTNVYITDYFDPLDSLSAQSAGCFGEALASFALRNWGVSMVEQPLQSDVRAAADGWNFIGGIRQAFQGHGVCHPLGERWINSVTDSFGIQGDDEGSWHANRQGQQVMANIVYNAVVPALVGHWTEVLGGGLTPSSPTAAGDGNVTYVFVRGRDNRINQNRRNGTAWTGWSEVPGGGSTLEAPDAVRYDGQISLFVRGTDNRIYQDRLNGTTWTGWSEVPGGGRTPSSPKAIAYQTPSGEALSLFVRGTDNRIYQDRLNGTTWTGWSEIPGAGSTTDAPDAVSYDGQLDLFVRGTDNGIYQNRLNGARWTGWSEVPGGGATVAAPAGVSYQGHLQLFVRGTDSIMYWNASNGTSWSGWSRVPGTASTPSAPAAIVEQTPSGEALTLFARGSDDRIYYDRVLP